MGTRWSGIAAGFGLALTLVLVAPGCAVRGQGSARVTATPVMVVDTRPPPARRVVRPAPRAGKIWVDGHWVRRSGRWEWQSGEWRDARTGYTWQTGQWVESNGRWRWIEGRWVGSASGGGQVVRDHRDGTPSPSRGGQVVRDHRDGTPAPSGGGTTVVRDHRDGTPAPSTDGSAVVYVDVAPPAPQYENPRARTGYVWQRGYWVRSGNRWRWHKGTWVKARVGYRWVPGRWETSNGRHYYVEGRWEQSATRDHRDRNRRRRDDRPRRKEYR